MNMLRDRRIDMKRVIDMRRVVTKAAVLAVLAVPALSGVAQAFTPVPIPKPQTSGVAATHQLP